MSVEASDINLMESPPDKVVLVGDVGVGKTTLFLRFKTGEFCENHSHNPREGEYHKKWQVEGEEVSVSAGHLYCTVSEVSKCRRPPCTSGTVMRLRKGDGLLFVSMWWLC